MSSRADVDIIQFSPFNKYNQKKWPNEQFLFYFNLILPSYRQVLPEISTLSGPSSKRHVYIGKLEILSTSSIIRGNNELMEDTARFYIITDNDQ